MIRGTTQVRDRHARHIGYDRVRTGTSRLWSPFVSVGRHFFRRTQYGTLRRCCHWNRKRCHHPAWRYGRRQKDLVSGRLQRVAEEYPLPGSGPGCRREGKPRRYRSYCRDVRRIPCRREHHLRAHIHLKDRGYFRSIKVRNPYVPLCLRCLSRHG